MVAKENREAKKGRENKFQDHRYHFLYQLFSISNGVVREGRRRGGEGGISERRRDGDGEEVDRERKGKAGRES